MTDDAPAGEGGPAKGKEGGLLKGLVDLATDWKVVVTAIAAGTSVFFSFEERDQKRLEVNQEAIAYVRQPETLDRFWNDPANTINEIQASYPQHAFCATLGVFLAEATRADIAEAARLQPERRIGATALNASREALLEETGRIAGELSYPLCLLTETARRTAEKSEKLIEGADPSRVMQPDTREACQPRQEDVPDGCAAIRASTSRYWRQLASDECVLALDAYGENVCLVELAMRRQANIDAQRRPGGAGAPPPVAEAEDGAEPAVAEGPGAADGAGAGPSEPPLATPGTVTSPGSLGVTRGVVLEPGAEPAGDERAADERAAGRPGPLGPGEDCGGGSPLVFAHVKDAANAELAEAAFAKLRALGWDITRPDPQPGARTAGDVRYYWAEQEACAAALARDVPRVLAPLAGRALETISLAGSYKNLPRGRMELWLPPL